MPSIEQALQQACQFGPGCPQRLGDAIRYAVLAPGKRLRPALVLMAAEACGGTHAAAMPGAVAVEMIHAYSLIHDDLPAMDDDDLRRGRPTVHIEFDEATAILAGDALQPLAIAHLCRHVTDPARAAQAVQILATAAGPEHLVGGQADDLAAESGPPPQTDSSDVEGADEQVAASNRIQSNPIESDVELIQRWGGTHRALEFLESIHRRKTGALFAASLDLGAVLSDASDSQRAALAAYAADIGLAFQVVDDLLDHTADETRMGKRVGKDAGRGKLTYPGLMGIDQARVRAAELIESAQQHTTPFGSAAGRLNQLAHYVLQRSH
ncbi:polyprenyl synthetase family protein [Stieleria tagensis]|uniref:polyprenyl synthetase family protein n=1 Tax=Stieleria tagensis TaxID=2956795 RepID=UPI00209B6400|nr:polyprenyl synthetase family protein [Stieleria tagensis]